MGVFEKQAMIVRHEWSEYEGDSENPEIVEKKMLLDEEIDVIGGRGGYSIERLADGGYRLKREGEDEFGICESLTEVILTKADLDRIKELEQKGML